MPVKLFLISNPDKKNILLVQSNKKRKTSQDSGLYLNKTVKDRTVR